MGLDVVGVEPELFEAHEVVDRLPQNAGDRDLGDHPEHDDLRWALRDGHHPPVARIVAAFVHPNDEKAGVEHVSIRNDSEEPLSVAGWRLLNRAGDATTLDGVVPARTARRFELRHDVSLSSRGGLIRLVDNQGEVVDEVSYTRHEVRRKHGSLTF